MLKSFAMLTQMRRLAPPNLPAIIARGAVIVILVAAFAPPYAHCSDSTPQTNPQKPHDPGERLIRLRKVWNEMIDKDNGGLGTDLDAAETRLEQGLDKWASESGIDITHVKFTRDSSTGAGNTPEEAKFRQSVFTIGGTGSLSSIGKLLHRIESAPLPVRITYFLIDPQRGKEGTDNLQFLMNVSTISRLPDLKQDADPHKAAETEAAMIEYAQHWRATARYLGCLRDLSLVFPDGAFVTHFLLQDTMKGEFSGKSTEPANKAVVDLKEKLDKNVRFEDVKLRTADRPRRDGEVGLHFTFTFKYVPE